MLKKGNKVDYQTFKTAFADYPLFSTKDIELSFPGFDRNNLLYWQEKNYIQKIRNAWYTFSAFPAEGDALFFVANQIYQPSYVSMESALSVYGFIPEGVFQITAVSTLKTKQFRTPLGTFSYQHLKPALFFGYRLEAYQRYFFKMATPEKAVLDFLYLRPELVTMEHIEGLRFNLPEIRRTLDVGVFNTFLDAFKNKALSKRAAIFLQHIANQ